MSIRPPLELEDVLYRLASSADARAGGQGTTSAQVAEEPAYVAEKQQLECAAQAQRDAEDELFAGLTEAQRAQLRRLLLVIRDQLEHNSACSSPDPAEATSG